MKYFFILLFMIVYSSLLFAVGSFESKLYENMDQEKLPYRIHVPHNIPEKSDGQLYPVILFFHGSGTRGSDNLLPVLGSPKNILRITEKLNTPVIIVVPQCPTGFQWSNTPPDAAWHSMDKYPTLPMKLAIEILESLFTDYPVDLSRIYTVGFSMGGYAVWEIVQRMPDIFAAGIPVCGGGDENLVYFIKDIPIWAFHGENDNVVPPARSRNMINSLKKSGGYPLYTEYKNTGHNSWTRTFSNVSVIRWLLDQSK